MRKFRKITALILTALLLAGLTALTASAEDAGSISVGLRIEGISENLYYNADITLPAGSTVADLVTVVNGIEGAPKITVSDSTYGAYVSDIGGLSEFAYGAMSGWNYRVNDVEPSVGISVYDLKDGDSVVYFYGDPFGVGMQHPIADLSRLYSNGVIAFTSADTEYDENWTPTVAIKPVAGATVTFDGAQYITDADGGITLKSTDGIAGFHAVQIERHDPDSGVPTVLRFAPGAELYLPFSDTPDTSAWYFDAVKLCVRDGYFIGADAARNTFDPSGLMSMAQLVTVLARVAGAGIDAGASPWYASALAWAVDNKIVAADEFVPGEPVSREKFIYMFYLTAALTGSYDMTAAADITDAADYNKITADYQNAVSWAVASGVIKGTDSSALVIDPSVNVSRATVCQMLLNYFERL